VRQGERVQLSEVPPHGAVERVAGDNADDLGHEEAERQPVRDQRRAAVSIHILTHALYFTLRYKLVEPQAGSIQVLANILSHTFIHKKGCLYIHQSIEERKPDEPYISEHESEEYWQRKLVLVARRQG